MGESKIGSEGRREAGGQGEREAEREQGGRERGRRHQPDRPRAPCLSSKRASPDQRDLSHGKGTWRGAYEEEGGKEGGRKERGGGQRDRARGGAKGREGARGEV